MRPHEVKPAGAQGLGGAVSSDFMPKLNQPFPLGHSVAFAVLLTALSLSTLASDDIVIDPALDALEQKEFNYDESQEIPWIEYKTDVLVMPKAQDLSPLDLDEMPAGMQLFVDKSRIAVNPEDGVVRMWLWVRSEFGAEQGSFEGFRCATREYKVYAYANPTRNPPVSLARKARWRVAKSGLSGNYRAELQRDYLCGISGARSPQEIRNNMSDGFRSHTFLPE
ncbi:MAG: CNP1-like family protein [Sedimenticolaceae bacterium]